MSFLVTALKWRPKTYSEVVGQEHITQTLRNAVQSGRIAHAYIFAGPRGVGKTTTARIFTRSINCLNPVDGEPCNECDVCKSFFDGKSLDIIEIDGASNRRIEEVRNLIESVKYSPTHSKYKVYIIDEVHMLTTEAFNALLKTLEEPPEHTKFIFATTDIHKVPATITSRCQRFDFRRIEVNAIKGTLKKIADEDDIKIDDSSLTFIAKKADGALRDAESLFDQVVSFCGKNVELEVLSKMLNLIDEEIYFEITDAILSKNFSAAFNITQKIYDNGWNFIDFANGLTEHFRNILTVIIRKDGKLLEVSENIAGKYLEYKDKFSEADIIKLLAYMNAYQYELKSSSNQKLKTEISLANIIALEKSSTIEELIEFVKKGEFPSAPAEKKKIIESEPPKPAAAGEVKSPASEPTSEKQTVTAPAAEPDKDIHEKWDELVKTVNGKRTIFGPVLNEVKLGGIENNVLKLYVATEEHLAILKDEKDYLHQRVAEIFGKGITCEFEIKKELFADSTPAASPQSDNRTQKTSAEENPLIKAIIEELGGKEI
ncbi:MAG: DNA polymerase III subunit gamma/tau [Chlorobi bacterium]|nr:DNA polymerase III subunit gamma/tau [Chlorobiota bacterium]